jgi:membrane-bound lytic murein transglycosylase A
LISWLTGLILILVGATSVAAADPDLEPVGYGQLQGWAQDDHGAALDAFRRSCREILDEAAGFSRAVKFGGSLQEWRAACQGAMSAQDPRRFFETGFKPYRVVDRQRPEGLFTGYFEPEVDGSLQRSEAFPVPIYRMPDDLVAFSEAEMEKAGTAFGRIVDGTPQPYLTRQQIEQGALAGKNLEIVWLRNWADAFFIHVQGSGRVRLDGGGVIRLSYSAKSGHPYTGIGGVLVERGELDREDMSMQAIRHWMIQNPKAARELMWENRSFIFFREADLEDNNLGAFGAQHVQLTPLRSLAVDRSYWMMGMPAWLETAAPSRDKSDHTSFRHLLIAQDTGSAIRGAVRGDIFWGFGETAGAIAGKMKSPGTMTVLLPLAVADELGLPR